MLYPQTYLVADISFCGHRFSYKKYLPSLIYKPTQIINYMRKVAQHSYKVNNVIIKVNNVTIVYVCDNTIY